MYKKDIIQGFVFVSTASALGKASTFFFLSGFICGKLQYLPFPLVSPICNGISLLFYMLGYSLWFIGSHFHPEHTYNENEWYGFAQFKEQHVFAAALGLVATVLSITGFFIPVLLVPAAWVFLASSCMWSISEYHKLKNPVPQDGDYSHTYQKSYFSYTLTLAAMGLVTAACTTLIFMFPPLTVPIFIGSGIIIAGLSLLAAEIWLNYMLDDHKPAPAASTSHQQMIETLGPQNELEETNFLAPYHGDSPLKTEQPHPAPQLKQPVSPQQACSMVL